MIPRVVLVRRVFRALVCAILASVPAFAANPAPSQLYYVPFPESDQLAAYSGVNSAAVDPLNIFVTFSASADNTVIYYDHWEDGYEADISNPTQSSTQVFGDGNSANGYPPGNAADLIPAGTVFSLRNYVTSTTGNGLIKFDARDKIASFKPISVTKTSYPASTNSLLAGSTEVLERGIWGTDYRVPVGVDMPTTTATSKLTWDADSFNYTSLSVMAGKGGATVQIDADNNGAFEQTVVLAEGGSVYVPSANVGGRVVSDNPVEVVMFAGRIGSNYQSRTGSLIPTNRWSTSYYAPVSTSASYATAVFLYNPGASAITVSYDYRNSATAYTTATVSVPAGGNARVNLSPGNDSTHFGAYRFYTTGASPATFYAFCAVDCASTSTGSNQAFDGGFTLVGQPSLTTQILVGLGIGRDPTSATNPSENGNPIWITTVGNGNTQAPVYVDYKGDNAGPLTDPNGNRYDLLLNLRELEQKKLSDPSGDQSGMLVYVLAPGVKVAGAWAQDPLAASTGQPGLDVASLIPPLREGDGAKGSSISIDADGDGFRSAGDTLEYDIRTVNTARTDIVGPFTVKDNLPASVNYVAGSARFRYSVAGAWQAWTAIPDDSSGTAFPLDGSGYGVPGTLKVGQQIQVTFRAAIKTYANLPVGTKEVTNTGSIVVTPFGVTIDLALTDPLFGSIGDRVWNDANGNAVQDSGEAGLNNVTVYLDLNGNGNRDTGEPLQVTAGNGDYAFNGLIAGTYQVAVDATTVSAINPGYGPTFDLDGIATSYRTSVVLASAQDRVDADFGFRIGASVGDRVWMDRNGDGLQGAGEPGIGGVRVYIDTNGNGSFDASEPNSITASDGSYFIGNLNPGTYTVRVNSSTLPTGAIQTYDLNGVLDHTAMVTLTSALHRGDLDFGYRGNQSIGDLVWDDRDGNATRFTYNIINGRIDLNNDGSANTSDDGFIGTIEIINGYLDLDGNGSINSSDAGIYQGFSVYSGGLDTNGSGSISNADDLSAGIYNETGLAGVRVFLDLDGNGLFEASEPSAVTDAVGAYTIGNLFNGNYSVRVDPTTLPASYVETYDLTAPTDDHAATVVLSGSSRSDVDFGYRRDASIGDRIWNDRNANGVVDAGEPGIEGVLVFIDANNNGIFEKATERFALTDVNGDYLINNLPAGTFLVRVELSTLPQGATQTFDLDGTGTANRASRTIALSETALDVDFGYRSSAEFGDLVWNDSNANGAKDVGESGIGGVRVYVDINGNGVFESASEPSAVTASDGSYTIGNLVPGTFTARIDTTTLPVGLVQTYDASGAVDHAATFSLTANQIRTEIDFGYTARVSIGDFVWNDVNGNGRQDGGESGIPNVTVNVFNAANDTIVGTAVTNSSGIYSFPTLMPGSYHLVFDTPVGFAATLAGQGNTTGDSDASATTGRTSNVTLTGGQSNITIDAGFYQPGSITGTVLADTDNNDSGDVAISGVSLTLKDSSGNDIDSDPVLAGIQPTTAVTDSNGIYIFANLRPGSYRVVETQPAGYLSVSDVDGANNNVIGDQNPILLSGGQTVSGRNFVEELPGTLAGHLYIDTNGNGIQDSGELDLADVDVVVTGSDGIVRRISSDSSGNWSVSLPPGNASADVDETDPQFPAGSVQTQGSDPTVTLVPTGASANGGIDGYFIPGSISGSVFANQDGSGYQALGGVLIDLRNSVGAPVLDGLGQTVTATTLPDGSYIFTGLAPGNYCVHQTQPSGYASVSDTDGSNNNVIGDESPIVVTAGVVNSGNNFYEIKLGVIGGQVRKETGSGETGFGGVILNLLDATGASVLDGANQPIRVASDSNGFYSFTQVPVGSYRVFETQPAGYGSVSDVDGANNNVIGDETPIVITPGLVVTGRDFVDIEYGSISGAVTKDTDANGSGDAAFQGVVLTLLDAAGDAVTSGGQPVTAITNQFGDYSFLNVYPGIYQVAETQPSGYGSVSDVDGGNPDLIGNVTAITVAPGQSVTGRDFVEIELGAISGFVAANGSPLANVMLTLLDNSGAIIDADPGTAGIQPITVVTDSNGFYIFNGVMPGSYQVAQTQPFGYNSDSDRDGGDLNIVGDVTRIVVSPGQTNTANNFVEVVITCASTWAEWQFIHPGETAGGNPDADNYDNFAEFAFAMPFDSGVGSPWLGSTAWIIQPSVTIPGTIEGVFIRPKGAVQNVAYTLQYAAALGSPTVWQSVAISPSEISTTDNGDCTETVTIHGLETLTGLTGGTGFVRIKADLDEDPPSGTDHSSFTEVEGWKDTGLELCCRTYSNPFLREAAFTGTITGVSGQALDLSGSGGGRDLGTIVAGGDFYLEVSSGDHEGQRFDVVSGTVDSLTLAIDSDLFEIAAPHNTRTGALPANLAGDTVVLRRHWTLGELFPAAGFGATDDPTTADQIQVFAAGVWSFYWLYDDGVNPPRWVQSGDNTYADQGGLVIPPGQGVFFNNRTSVTSILAYGEVRANDFIRPLAIGSNLVSGGYPFDQSAASLRGRNMTVAQGFFGSRDIATADTFYAWRGDSTIGATGYDSWFLNDNSPRLPHVVKWVKIGDASLLARDAELLLLGNRSVFIRSRNGSTGYTDPLPWSP